MSTSNKEIRKALRTKLVSIPGIPDEDNQAWQNKVFEPTDGTPWIRETLLPSDERMTANNEKEAVGIYQIDYFVPIGESVYDAEDLADAIKNAFKPTTVLSGFLRIERSRLLPGNTSGPWYKISVVIDYKCFSTN
ncbi:MAG: hypothetical protein HUJ22_04675 [Gracilimonas sp.]|uniref:phage tail terminator-like protein n=1 Tax=Gracilimonas sp. TaxID=1974203 RepID=UPI00198C0CA9|nr:phage tail terminator-like protein [Gracilimonas sp.]MBD3615847.1 hypothetical protein [Gracilimonas sp.]